jgi:hypothetical protein
VAGLGSVAVPADGPLGPRPRRVITRPHSSWPRSRYVEGLEAGRLGETTWKPWTS